MAGNRLIKLEDLAFDALVKQGIFSVDSPETTTLANQQKILGVIEKKIHERLIPLFLQAVIDDDRKKVAALLDKNPELLLMKAQKGIEIESQYTWLKIDAENEDALSIAAKRKQINMIKLLLPYYDKLEQTNDVIKAKAEALSAWKNYALQKNEEGKDEIVIPQEYAIYAQSLIDVCREETFPNGVPGEDEIPIDVALSDETELAFSTLFNILLPKKAVKLDDYIDPELFLLALYQAYVDNFHSFQNWEQRDAFCVRMIGLAQSVLSPEIAKIFCEGLYYVVEENRKISARADSLKLYDGESFYRSYRGSHSGLGFQYLCTFVGTRATSVTIAGGGQLRRATVSHCVSAFGKVTSSKSNHFLEHYAAIAAAKPTFCRS